MNSSGFKLNLEHHFDAPREDVFDAWTDPDVLKKWWAAMDGGTTPRADVDLRVGGQYRLSMQPPQRGDVYTTVGEYREVRRPERLVYTWRWDGMPAEQGGSEDTLVTVEFLEDGGGTLVRLTHEGFANEQVRDEHAHGWQGCLANLERRVYPSKVGG